MNTASANKFNTVTSNQSQHNELVIKRLKHSALL